MNGALLAAAARNRDIAMAFKMPEANQVRFKIVFEGPVHGWGFMQRYCDSLKQYVQRDRLVGANANLRINLSKDTIDSQNDNHVAIVDISRSAASLVSSYLTSNPYVADDAGYKIRVKSGIKTTSSHGEMKTIERAVFRTSGSRMVMPWFVHQVTHAMQGIKQRGWLDGDNEIHEFGVAEERIIELERAISSALQHKTVVHPKYPISVQQIR